MVCVESSLDSHRHSAKMSSSEAGAAKAQPWKAHWTPAKTQAPESTAYLVDDSGDLLIDGMHNCASGEMFSELGCSRKVEIKERDE